MVGYDDGLMGGQFSGTSRSTDMHALPAVAITATVMLPFMFCQLLQQVCASRKWVSCLFCRAFCMYVCICIYMYICICLCFIDKYIYIRLYAELCTYDMIDYVLILRASLLQDSFRIDSAGFFTTGSISY